MINMMWDRFAAPNGRTALCVVLRYIADLAKPETEDVIRAKRVEVIGDDAKEVIVTRSEVWEQRQT